MYDQHYRLKVHDYKNGEPGESFQNLEQRPHEPRPPQGFIQENLPF